MSIPIVGQSPRDFNEWVTVMFGGNYQRAILALTVGAPPVTEQDMRDFVAKIPREEMIMAVVLEVYYMASSMYADFLAQKHALANHLAAIDGEIADANEEE